MLQTNNQKTITNIELNTENTVTYGAQIWKLKKHLESKHMSMEMDFRVYWLDTQD